VEIEARQAYAQDEINKQKLSGPEAENYLREVAAEIKAKTKDVQRDMTKNLLDFFDDQLKAADAAFEQALQPSQAALSLAQGARAGLDRVSLQGRVPDYVRTIADRRVGEASDAADAAQIPANEALLGKYAQIQADANAQLTKLRASQAANPDDLTTGGAIVAAELQLTALNEKIQQVSASQNALKASFAGSDLLPQNLGQALNQAIEAYKIANGFGQTFAEQLRNEVGGALEAVTSGLQTMFTTIITGSGSALGAIAAFAKSIIAAIQQIVAKMIATKIINMLIGLVGSFGGAAAGGASTSSQSGGTAGGGTVGGGGSFMPTTLRFNGGPIGFNSGGRVMNGYPNRDSVHAKLAKGEFVVRKSAVDSVGPEFMENLNKRGARALAGMSQSPIIMPKPAHQETNVYITQPNRPPPLGPNDILMVLQDDILKDGSTKKLIKQVAQGG
jgi:lambda family phage tail tape measure protein